MRNLGLVLMRAILRRQRLPAGGVLKPTREPSGPMFQLSPGYYFPAGNDPYGPHFGDTDCAIDMGTGECVRDHPGPHKSLHKKTSKET